MAGELLEQFRKNFEYDRWANERFVRALEAMAGPPEKAVQVLGHILFAKDVWLARLRNEDLSRFSTPWPPYSLSECRTKLDEVQGEWKKYLTALRPEGLGVKISYTNTQGKSFEQKVQNVLVHVVNHSHYHRGQLATLVTAGGGKRPDTDYIGYAMEIGEGGQL